MSTGLLIFFLFLVEVHSQSAPYVSFGGEALLNHSYVNLNFVGNADDGSDNVQCRTDLETCCAISIPGNLPGDWYFPEGNRVIFESGDGDIYQRREAQRVDLRSRNNAASPSGIYLCVIPTVAVHDNTDTDVRETVYVGIYSSGGHITILFDDVTFGLISDDEFILTCISTGGPATTVTWTRDSVNVTEGTETVFDTTTAHTTAEYTHTLTGNTAGEYRCTVSNAISSASATLTVLGAEPPTNVMAERASPTSILVSWNPPDPLGGTTGYRIDYTRDGDSGDIVTVNGGFTNEILLTDLLNGATYSISIVATSSYLPSEIVVVTDVHLVPGQPSVTLGTITSTSIFLSWSVPSGSIITNYTIAWERDVTVGCPNEDEDSITIIGDSTSYDIMGLEEDSRYTIVLAISNAAGSSTDSDTVMTEEAVPSAAPSSVNISEVTSSSLTVQWGMVPCTHRNGDIIGYSVLYIESGDSDTVPVSGSDTLMVTISGLMYTTTYSIQVAAVNSIGTGVYSTSKIEQTADVLSVISIDSSSPTTLIISWTLDEEGVMVENYTIFYSTTDSDCFTDTGGITGIAGDETMHTLTGLEEGTEYSITVTAMLTDGESGEDDGIGTTLDAAPSVPPASVRGASMLSSITVQWDAVPCIHRNGDIAGYIVQYIGSGSTDTMSVSGREATITGLMLSTTYSITVAAVNSAGVGAYSDPILLDIPQSVFLSLNGDNIPNHGYVEINEIGFTNDDALLCITNGVANGDGSEGNWFAPDGVRVNLLEVLGLRRNRDIMVVRLFRIDGTTPAEGIYQCVVMDATEMFRKVYVGLYNSGGGVIDVQSVVFRLDDVASPQFTLTCISTGGPATTVTWTRDSVTVTEGTETVLDDQEEAQYTHTLTVTGRLGGDYTCTVANDVSPGISDSLIVTVASAPTNFRTVQKNTTSIHLLWSPPDPLGDTAGYIISHTGGSSDTVTICDGSTDNYLLTGLVMDSSYTISIVATSEHIPSVVLVTNVTLVVVPGQPSVSVTSITATSISLSWSVPSGPVVTSYEVMWHEAGSGMTEMTSGSLTDTSYTIEQLDSTTIYTITVIAINSAGNTDGLPVIISTGSDSCPAESCDCRSSETDNTTAIIGGVVVAVVLILSVTVVIVMIGVLVLKSRQGQYTTGPSKGDTVVIPGATNAIELLTLSEEPTYVDPDAIRTSNNDAYNIVSQTEGTTGDYEAVSDPDSVPPS